MRYRERDYPLATVPNRRRPLRSRMCNRAASARVIALRDGHTDYVRVPTIDETREIETWVR